jgi:adenylate kinase family enzyme
VSAADSDLVHRARRILVYGVTGSGKSTAAGRIAAALRLPCHLADELTWEPGWTPVDGDEQRRRFTAIAAGEAWVLDTAYSAWSDVVLPRTDLVVGLDYPRWFSLQRLVRRTVRRITDRKPICNGNVETVGAAVGRDSILRWHFRSFRRKRDRMRSWYGSPGGPPTLLFARSTDLDAWIGRLDPAGAPAGPATRPS